MILLLIDNSSVCIANFSDNVHKDEFLQILREGIKNTSPKDGNLLEQSAKMCIYFLKTLDTTVTNNTLKNVLFAHHKKDFNNSDVFGTIKDIAESGDSQFLNYSMFKDRENNLNVLTNRFLKAKKNHIAKIESHFDVLNETFHRKHIEKNIQKDDQNHDFVGLYFHRTAFDKDRLRREATGNESDFQSSRSSGKLFPS